MKQTWWKISVVVILVVAIVAVIAQKQQKQSAAPRDQQSSSASAPTEQAAPQQPTTTVQPKTTATADAPVKSGEVCPTPVPKPQANVSAKGNGQTTSAKGNAPTNPPKTTTAPMPKPKALPRLVDVGSTQCIPCKMMAPILEQLKTEYKGQLVVEFVDINENRDAAAQYGVDTIPTQIFYDANGKEFSRHIGFFPKDDILTTFTKQGITLTK